MGNDSENITYVLQGSISRFIKIGRTRNETLLGRRIKKIQAHSAERLTLLTIVDRDVELELHRDFREDRIHGEWFWPPRRLCRRISHIGRRGQIALPPTEQSRRIVESWGHR